MGDQNDRRAAVAIERAEQLENAVTRRIVEVAGRLVGKENLGGVGKGARDSDSLLFSTG